MDGCWPPFCLFQPLQFWQRLSGSLIHEHKESSSNRSLSSNENLSPSLSQSNTKSIMIKGSLFQARRRKSEPNIVDCSQYFLVVFSLTSIVIYLIIVKNLIECVLKDLIYCKYRKKIWIKVLKMSPSGKWANSAVQNNNIRSGVLDSFRPPPLSREIITKVSVFILILLCPI